MKILSLFWHSVESDSMAPRYFDGSSPKQSIFREQARYIKDHYTPISIIDFLKIRNNSQSIKALAKPPVLLGFDDGFRNVITNALPVLKEFAMPAVLFVIGEILKDPDYVPWYVEIEHFIRRTEKGTVSYKGLNFDLAMKQDCSSLKLHLKNNYKVLTAEEDRQDFLNDLSSVFGVERSGAQLLDEDLCFVSKSDLSELGSKSLLTVASHAMTHRYLATLSREEQVYELKQSHLLLGQHCESYYPAISYPLGSFNQDTIDIAKGVYEFGFAVSFGASYNNYYAYPRKSIRNDTYERLKYVLSPLRLKFLLPIKKVLHNIGIRRIDRVNLS